jgi:hypothetical protein
MLLDKALSNGDYEKALYSRAAFSTNKRQYK